MSDSHPASSPTPYRVLARKYRPQRFSELIGQDAMVTTLGNAIKRDRLAHAFLLTGVRGVGKTSTARLIAKALNCVGPDGQGGPTIDPCGQCEPCRAIAEGRHIDVIEMDAASHTGVDDIREIIEAVRYAAVSARYKVYIIDEVHMLSKSAFNALLKTLEEPPPHVKFLFATTEVQKVPVTVLSRCQRFDLKRIPSDRLARHFSEIADHEAIEAEPEALALIARAAEGSVRDGLSILDQAIAHAEGNRVAAAQVRDMLGLSDRGAVRVLLQHILAGEASAVLAGLRAQYDLGTEPAAVLRELLETVHGITRAKIAHESDPAMSVEEREALNDWASRLGFGPLHRLWQMLLKGLAEVQTAPLPIEAAEMALLRLVYASSLPDPGDLVRKLSETADSDAPAPSGQAHTEPSRAEPPRAEPVAARPQPVEQPVGQAVTETFNPPADFAALVSLIDGKGEHILAHRLHDDVGLVSYAPPELKLKPLAAMPADFPRDLAGRLKTLTGASWLVSLGDGEAAPSLRQQAEQAEQRARESILSHPDVQAAIEAFPQAELIDYRLDEAAEG